MRKKIGLLVVFSIGVGTTVLKLFMGNSALSAIIIIIALLFFVPIGIYSKSVLQAARKDRMTRGALLLGFFIVFWLAHAAIVWDLCVKESVATGLYRTCAESGGGYCGLITGLMNMVRVLCSSTEAVCGIGLAYSYSAIHTLVLLIVCVYPIHVYSVASAKKISVELVRERYGKCRIDLSLGRGKKIYLAAVTMLIIAVANWYYIIKKIILTVKCTSFDGHSLSSKLDALLYGQNQFLSVVYSAMGIMMTFMVYAGVFNLFAMWRYRLRMSRRHSLGR